MTLRFRWEKVLIACTLPTVTKTVGLVLATYANSDGTQARPGQQLLATNCGLKSRAVRNHLERLEELGLIGRTFRGSSAGRAGLADVYRLLIPERLPAHVAPAEWCLEPEHRHPGAGVTALYCRPVVTDAGLRGDQNTGTPVPNTGTPVPEHRHPGAAHHPLTTKNSFSASVDSSKSTASRGATTLPANWRPNHTHCVVATQRGVDINEVLEAFLSATVADERRADWDRTFGAFLTDYTEGYPEYWGVESP